MPKVRFILLKTTKLKIIDQTYSSLDVSARPQSHTVVIHSPPSSKEVETFVQSPAEGHLSLRFRVSDHISDSAPDTDKPDERDIRTSPLSQFDIVVGEQSSLQFEESDHSQILRKVLRRRVMVLCRNITQHRASGNPRPVRLKEGANTERQTE